jgi:hypothetical protein
MGNEPDKCEELRETRLTRSIRQRLRKAKSSPSPTKLSTREGPRYVSWFPYFESLAPPAGCASPSHTTLSLFASASQHSAFLRTIPSLFDPRSAPHQDSRGWSARGTYSCLSSRDGGGVVGGSRELFQISGNPEMATRQREENDGQPRSLRTEASLI